MVERTGVEPVTSTLPVLRATNCANAPCSIFKQNLCYNCVMFNNTTKIFFLGPSGTYAQIAMEKFMGHFGIKCPCEPVSTIKKVLEQFNKNNNCLAVVPIENSVEGVVRETVDNILTAPVDVEILAQTSIPVAHCLISKGKMENIKTIISHPQALSQCQNFIADNFGNDINILSANSTSSATCKLKDLNDTYASIANGLCAKMYEMEIVAENINDNKDNQTRFALIGKKVQEKLSQTRTSIAFSTKNQPGALLKVLEVFKKYDLNLIYLESRPDKKTLGDYVFFADIDKGIQEIAPAIKEIEKLCDSYRLLGSYSVL